MKDEIHRDRFHVPDNLRVIPKGTRRWINGTVYYWNGKKWQQLHEKRDGGSGTGGNKRWLSHSRT